MQVVHTRRKRDCIVAAMATLLGLTYEQAFDDITAIEDLTIEAEIAYLINHGYENTRKVIEYDLDAILYVKVPSLDVLGAVRTVIWNGPEKQFIDPNSNRDDKTPYTEDAFFAILPKSCVILVE